MSNPTLAYTLAATRAHYLTGRLLHVGETYGRQLRGAVEAYVLGGIWLTYMDLKKVWSFGDPVPSLVGSPYQVEILSKITLSKRAVVAFLGSLLVNPPTTEKELNERLSSIVSFVVPRHPLMRALGGQDMERLCGDEGRLANLMPRVAMKSDWLHLSPLSFATTALNWLDTPSVGGSDFRFFLPESH